MIRFYEIYWLEILLFYILRLFKILDFKFL